MFQHNLDLLRQISEILYVYYPFINIYKTAAEQIKSFATNTTEEICVVLNPQMKLLLKLGVDRRQSNLPTIDKIAIIIPKEYNQARFHDIVLAYIVMKITIISIILLAQIQLLICLFTIFYFFLMVI